MLAVPIEHLSNIGGWAAIFANIHIGGRQIDFLVATDSPDVGYRSKVFLASCPRQGQWPLADTRVGERLKECREPLRSGAAMQRTH
ncbi:hypothetical protein [Pseudoxanthomonas spadix]|uniref:hypothetical protein n=1 Tax=Pseudoxanthomonas spadix TaxID=415229 RepID=UPI0011D28B53|nr:hypothetical protein [Pseudoxanthomonas spadix]